MHFVSNMLDVSSSVSYCKLMTFVREAFRKVTTVVSGAIGQAITPGVHGVEKVGPSFFSTGD